MVVSGDGSARVVDAKGKVPCTNPDGVVGLTYDQ